MRGGGLRERGGVVAHRFLRSQLEKRWHHQTSLPPSLSPPLRHPERTTHLVVVVLAALAVVRRVCRVARGGGCDGDRRRRSRSGRILHVVVMVVVVLALLRGGHVERRLRGCAVHVRLTTRLQERVAVVEGRRARGGRLSLRRRRGRRGLHVFLVIVLLSLSQNSNPEERAKAKKREMD